MAKEEMSITVAASLTELDTVIGFVEEMLKNADCPLKNVMQIAVCVEEIFVNVTSYAYGESNGDCEISIVTECPFDEQSGRAIITISDCGKEFNPLQHDDPDVTLSADERKIGGLGIYMVKKSMDSVSYSYENEKNILQLEKSWNI